jgi:hypothetical protein
MIIRLYCDLLGLEVFEAFKGIKASHENLLLNRSLNYGLVCCCGMDRFDHQIGSYLSFFGHHTNLQDLV